MTAALTEAGLSDEAVTSALTKLYSNEKLSPKLNSLVKTATEDYNAQLGRVASTQQKLDQYEKEWYPKANGEYQRMKAEYDKAMAELQRIQTTGVMPEFDASKYMSREDYVKDREAMGERFGSLLKDGLEIASEHGARFHEKLDVSAIEKIANETKLPLRGAYEKWIEPRVKEQEVEARKNWEKTTREEIERDVRSRYRLPAEAVPTETSPMYNRLSADQVPKDMDQELLAAWNGAGAAK